MDQQRLKRSCASANAGEIVAAAASSNALRRLKGVGLMSRLLVSGSRRESLTPTLSVPSPGLLSRRVTLPGTGAEAGQPEGCPECQSVRSNALGPGASRAMPEP